MARILVVDDDKLIRKMICDMLRHSGYEVEGAPNAFRALELLGDQRFDLVLLDVMMPNMDGYELMSTIREDAATSEVPVIAVTALDDEKNRQRVVDLGFFDHVTKPFEQKRLLEAVARALGGG